MKHSSLFVSLLVFALISPVILAANTELVAPESSDIRGSGAAGTAVDDNRQQDYETSPNDIVQDVSEVEEDNCE